MKNIIFCFTGTGNSLDLAKELEKNLENTEIYPMTEKNKSLLELEKYNKIGFIFPVYGFGAPKVVKDFISSLNFSNNKESYIFSLATCGGQLGNALKEINYILKEKNLKLNYGTSIRTPDNYIILYNPEEFTEEMFLEYKKSIKTVLKNLELKINLEFKNPNIFLGLITNLFSKFIKSSSKNFNVSENCIGCNICEEICLVKNIEMENNKPVFLNNCQQCLSCISYCPERAINYKNKTNERNPYTNKNINSKKLKEFNNK